MIRLITTKEYNRLKDIEVHYNLCEDQVYHLNASIRILKSGQKEIKCSATNCMDNENGKCILNTLSIDKNGICGDYDAEGAMKEFLDETKKSSLKV